MNDHHPTMPPSAAPAIMKCACYQPGKGGEAADKGTDQHEYLAALLTGNPDRAMVLGMDAAEVEAVEWAYDWIVAKFPAFDDFDKPLIEEKVEVFNDDFEVVTHGRLDFFHNGILIDYKSGEIRDYDAQAACYSLAMMQRTGLKSVESVLLYGRYKKAVITTHTLEAAQAVVNELVRRRTDPHREPTPCDYCGWCAANVDCPAIKATALAIATGYQPPTFKDWHSSSIEDPTTMAQMLTVADIVEDWCESVKSHAKAMVIEKGIQIPGYVLRSRSGTRSVGDLQKAFEQMGLPPEAFLPACSTTVAKLEKAYGAHFNQKGKALEAAVATRLGDNLVAGKMQQFLTKKGEKE